MTIRRSFCNFVLFLFLFFSFSGVNAFFEGFEVGSSEDLNFEDPCDNGFNSFSSVLSASGINLDYVDEVYDWSRQVNCPLEIPDTFCFQALDIVPPTNAVCAYKIGVKLYSHLINESCGSSVPISFIPLDWGYGSQTHCYSNSMLGGSCCFGSLKTCSSLGGRDVCSETENCPGNLISGSVDPICCSVECVPKSCSERGGYACVDDEVCIGEEISGFVSETCCSSPCIKEDSLSCNSCSNCGDDFFNICDEDECKNSCALSEENGCVFTSSGIGGSCESTPVYPVTQCGVLNESGVYKLQNDIYLTPDMPEFVNQTGGYCFYIIADDVVLDLNGHVISGDVLLKEDTAFRDCQDWTDNDSCYDNVLPMGTYSFFDFWTHYSIDIYSRTGVYPQDLMGRFGGIYVLSDSSKIKGGQIGNFLYDQIVFQGIERPSLNEVNDVNIIAGFITNMAGNLSKNNVVRLNNVNFESGANMDGFGAPKGIYSYSTGDSTLELNNVRFDNVNLNSFNYFLVWGSNLKVPYNFFSNLSFDINEFAFNSGMGKKGNLILVDNIFNPQISFTMFGPTMASYEGGPSIKNAIRFENAVFDGLDERVNFSAFPELDVPTQVVNKNQFYNPPLTRYSFKFVLSSGESIKIPKEAAFSSVSFFPYLNFTYTGLEFCNSTIYSHCSGGRGCNGATYRCN